MADEQDIKKMKRGELNELATEYGLNPDEYRRADDLRTAIFDHIKNQSEEQVEATDADSTESVDAAEEQTEEQEEEKKKGPKPRETTHVERKGKKYKAAAEKIDKTKQYDLPEAVKLAQDTATTSFDSTVEVHIRLNVDPKKADQNIRGSIVLPNGTGKDVKVAVMAEDEDAEKAKKAGADVTDSETLLNELSKGNIDFDVLIATPQQMGKLGKHAKLLGPKGLMPNPKSGTVTANVEKAVKEAKAGRIEFRVDKYGIIHTPVGKVSFKSEELADNVRALLKAIREARPTSVKNEYFNNISITTTMGPSVKVNV